ncbi:MAG: hypothetical protein GXO10_07380 [Crenarchaeota archaeon]|nr:hypothetical protein [Thermoproteota archaeon]
MSGRVPKVSGRYFTFISTGSYVIGLEDDEILIGDDAIKRMIEHVSDRFLARCYECGRLISPSSLGLVKVVDGEVKLVLCRDCVVRNVNAIGKLIEECC